MARLASMLWAMELGLHAMASMVREWPSVSYTHLDVYKRQGLRELGIPYYASADYWRQSPGGDDYLFRATPDVRPDDCDVVVLPYTWFNWVLLGALRPIRREVPEGLFKTPRRYRTVYMDTNDGIRTVSWEPSFRRFDVILRSKYCRRAWNPGNLRPWVMGLSNRMLRMTEGAPAFAARARTLLVNFGASHSYPHGARLRSHEKFDPVAGRILEFDAVSYTHLARGRGGQPRRRPSGAHGARSRPASRPRAGNGRPCGSRRLCPCTRCGSAGAS